MSSRWTFLSSHGRVFEYVATHDKNIADIMAREIGVTQRVIFMILKDLENEGYITRKKVGRCNHYEIHSDLPMKHPLDYGRTAGEILPRFKIQSQHGSNKAADRSEETMRTFPVLQSQGIR